MAFPLTARYTRYAAAVLVVGLGACSAPASSGADTQPGDGCNLANFLAVQHAHVNRAEVTLCGTVTRVRPVRVTRSGAHRVFIVDVGRSDRIEVDSNVDIMGDFPIETGERAVVRGEYYYDGSGREGVHFTHRARGGRHEPGFVSLGGHTYR